MDIWAKWQNHYSSLGINPERICRDGILCPDSYKKTNLKVLFVLKEVNDFGGGNLSNFVKEGPRYQAFHTLSRWAAGLVNGFPSFEDVNQKVKKESLHKVAALNLKKASGGSTADMSVINAYAFRDRMLLLEQFQQISPKVVVACGTFEILIWLLGLDVNPEQPASKPIYDSSRDVWVVPFRHPSRANRTHYDQLKSYVEKEPQLWKLLNKTDNTTVE